MGGSLSSLNTSTSGGKHKDDGLQLVLYVLPVLKELTKHLEKDFDPRDKRYGYLGNVHTATTVVDGHLSAIQEAGMANLFKAHIQGLAHLLEEVFDDTVIDVAQLKVSIPPQPSIAADCRVPSCPPEVFAIDRSTAPSRHAISPAPRRAEACPKD